MSKDFCIVIPTRLCSTRLPNKAIAYIDDKVMVQHVYESAMKSGVGDVFIAAYEEQLYNILISLGMNAIHINEAVPTGSDFVYLAYQKLGGAEKYKYVINLQGDVPTIRPDSIQKVARRIEHDDVDVATLVTLIEDNHYQRNDPHTVKAIITKNAKAIYFTRAANVPFGEGPLYHHIGIYAYTSPAISRFAKLPVSDLEKRERLEQLRILEDDMTIGVTITDDNPHGVDTPEDLELVRNEFMKKNNQQ